MAADFDVVADLKARGKLCVDAATVFVLPANLNAQGDLDASLYTLPERLEQVIEAKNATNLARWRRKMRCKEAVESVGEYGSYPDLRNADQRRRWRRICERITSIRCRQEMLPL